jgi:hypothetical protein
MPGGSGDTKIYNHSSTNVGVIVNEMPAGNYYYFYDDSPHKELLASFSCDGTGFINYQNIMPNSNGKSSRRAAAANPIAIPHYVSTKKSGRVCAKDGTQTSSFDWAPKRKGFPFGPKAPIKFMISPSFTFNCTQKHDQVITFRSSKGFIDFAVGSPPLPVTRLQKTTTLSGKATMRLPANLSKTLLERQNEKAQNPAAAVVAAAQKHGWALPSVSPSGRECAFVAMRPDLEGIRKDGDEFIEKIQNFRTTIGVNKLAYSSEALRAKARTQKLELTAKRREMKDSMDSTAKSNNARMSSVEAAGL